jgi:hypothetical protein
MKARISELVMSLPGVMDDPRRSEWQGHKAACAPRRPDSSGCVSVPRARARR